MDPTELWRQWYEAGSKMWTEALQGSQENYMDPFGIYRQWFSNMEDTRERMQSASEEFMPAVGGMPSMGEMPQVDSKGLQENMQRWMEMSADAYRRIAENQRGVLETLPRWFQTLEEARSNFLQAESLPTDPVSFGVQWYNATSGPVSKFTEELLQEDKVLGPSSRYLERYTTFYKLFRRNAEESLSVLQLPTRSDIARVANLVISLEDKVDNIEEAFENFEYGYTQPATAESIVTLEGRIDRVENKLDQLLTAVEAISQNGSSGENGAAAETNGSSDSASSSESSEVSASVATSGAASGVSSDREQIKATGAARRKAEELGVDLAEVEGSGADGQITVEDVRKKGES